MKETPDKNSSPSPSPAPSAPAEPPAVETAKTTYMPDPKNTVQVVVEVAEAEAEAEAPPPTPPPPEYLLFCGSTKWNLLGRKTMPKAVVQRGGTDAGEELLTPTRLRFQSLPDVRFRAVFSGCGAAHLVLVDADGMAYGLGRNDAGQLAQPDLRARRHPVRLVLPDTAHKVVQAACGRAHTLLVIDDGAVFAVGSNMFGQLGNASRTDLKNPGVPSLQRMLLPKSERGMCAAAGADFSVVACESGAVYTMGHGQYGQLGNGRTGECIETGNRLAFDAVSTPMRVDGFGAASGEVRVVQVACGMNHTVALDADGKVWSWGFGGYGRLGHKGPKDELRPRRIESFAGGNYKLDMVRCGQQASFAVQRKRKSCYMWGMTKRTGESTMYPKPVFELQGWEIRSLGCGGTSTVAAAERSVISWGCSPTCGELGYGDNKPKSSTKPQVMESVEGLVVSQVAEGMAFTGMLVRVETAEERNVFEKLPVLEVEDEEVVEEGEEKGAKVGKGAKGKGAKRKAGEKKAAVKAKTRKRKA